jgi:acetyl esterase/lipase
MRAQADQSFARLSSVVNISDYLVDQRNVTLGGVPSVISTPVDIRPAGGNSSGTGVNSSVIFWLHGGAYFVGSCYGGQVITVAGAARAGGLTIVCPEYRLAPEHPFPAGLDDAVAAYKALIQDYPPTRVAVVGDSAGGGLAMALLLRLQKEGVALPGAVGLMSPWTDLLAVGDTTRIMVDIDPVLSGNVTSVTEAYVGGNTTQLKDPLVSPLYGNYSTAAVGDLPPILIQVGLREVLLSDSVNLYRQLRRAGHPATLDVWEGMFHVFQTYAFLPEAQEAANAMGDYLRARLQG